MDSLIFVIIALSCCVATFAWLIIKNNKKKVKQGCITMKNGAHYRRACYLLFLGISLNACKDDSQVVNTQSNKKQAFLVGVAVDINEFNFSSTYTNIVTSEFSSITAENVFKAENLHPTQTEFYWSDADALINFCLQNNKRMHGHTLIWHNQLPIWIEDFNGTKADWEQLFKNHIQTIITHFKGKVASWDVVNEAFNEDGTLRNTIWKQHIGDDYIEKAFLFAKQADDRALLFYNDFNLESNKTKRNAVIAYFNNLRNKGISIDGIGLQMHIGILYPSTQQIGEAIQTVASNNFKLHISEFDISVNQLNQDIEPDAKLFNAQADVLAKVITHYKQIPKHLQFGVTFWGVSDKHSWIRIFFNREDYPLLFDDNYNKKPAYNKMKALMLE